MKNGILLIILILGTGLGTIKAQIRINDPGKVAERQAENRANRKIDQTVDKGFDKIEEGIGSLFKKKDKKDKKGNDNKEKEVVSETSTGNADNSGASEKATAGKIEKASLKSYGKFDFIPGEKVVAMEDFSQDQIGDFPAKWNTNSSAELVTIDGTEGKWLMLGPEGVFYPEFIQQTLPDNFTLEFNLASTTEFSFYSGFFRTIIAQTDKPALEFANWRSYDGGKKNGLEFGLHPRDAGGRQGIADFQVFGAAVGREVMKNAKSFPEFHIPEHNVVKVSVWRQKTRLRVYVDGTKVWDLPRVFVPDTKYNFIGFSNGGYSVESDRYFISNIRVALGAPDTRSKLITDGKFSTTGILFDVNSANIKPESYGVLKEIAGVLTDNAAVKVKIIGHTDSDGDDASNLALSKKRSEAVKQALSSEFGITAARMETDGKGEADPVTANTTSDGKANNRRVEFIKL